MMPQDYLRMCIGSTYVGKKHTGKGNEGKKSVMCEHTQNWYMQTFRNACAFLHELLMVCGCPATKGYAASMSNARVALMQKQELL